MNKFVDEKLNITLYNDDCINVLKQLKDNSIDCIITDPPYDVSVNHDGGKLYHNKGITKSNEDLVRDKIDTGYDIETIGKELLRVCKEPNIYIWCNAQPKTNISKFLNAYKSASSRLIKKKSSHK